MKAVRSLVTTVAVGAALALVAPAAHAAPGDLDTSFSLDGVASMNISLDGTMNDEFLGSTRQADGRIVAVGSAVAGGMRRAAIVRFLVDGTLDSTFDADGVRLVDIGPGTNNVLADVAVQGDGRIVAAGMSGSPASGAIVRFNSDGSLDGSFGAGGIVANASFPTTTDSFMNLELQPDGSIVVAGMQDPGAAIDQVSLVQRYTSMGAPDASFNGGLPLTFSGCTQDDFAMGMDRTPGGHLGITGYCGSVFGINRGFIAMVRPNGTLETGFNGSGTRTFDTSATVDGLFGIAAQPDGKLVAGGARTSGSDVEVETLRVNPDGTLDVSYGSGGYAFHLIAGAKAHATDLDLQFNGDIVVSGRIDSGAGWRGLVMHLTSNGAVDTTFGTDGRREINIACPFFGLFCQGYVQPDGRILFTGQSMTTPTDVAIARVLGDTPAPAPTQPTLPAAGDGAAGTAGATATIKLRQLTRLNGAPRTCGARARTACAYGAATRWMHIAGIARTNPASAHAGRTVVVTMTVKRGSKWRPFQRMVLRTKANGTFARAIKLTKATAGATYRLRTELRPAGAAAPATGAPQFVRVGGR